MASDDITSLYNTDVCGVIDSYGDPSRNACVLGHRLLALVYWARLRPAYLGCTVTPVLLMSTI